MTRSTRRELLATLAAAPLAAELASASPAASRPLLEEGDLVLFQGDSITDAGRSREREGEANDRAALGNGYALLAAAGMHCARPAAKLRFHNRGISGNKVFQLAERWEKDCLDLAPDVLSILIGVNDIWHKLNGRYEGTAETYRDGFAALLKRTREALPSTTIVVCEPFVLMSGTVKQNQDKWFPEFDVRRGYAKEVAQQAEAIWVPFQTMFDEAVANGAKPESLAGDGVHPTPQGHELMAKTWREVVGI